MARRADIAARVFAVFATLRYLHQGGERHNMRPSAQARIKSACERFGRSSEKTADVGARIPASFRGAVTAVSAASKATERGTWRRRGVSVSSLFGSRRQRPLDCRVGTLVCARVRGCLSAHLMGMTSSLWRAWSLGAGLKGLQFNDSPRMHFRCSGLVERARWVALQYSMCPTPPWVITMRRTRRSGRN